MCLAKIDSTLQSTHFPVTICKRITSKLPHSKKKNKEKRESKGEKSNSLLN